MNDRLIRSVPALAFLPCRIREGYEAAIERRKNGALRIHGEAMSPADGA